MKSRPRFSHVCVLCPCCRRAMAPFASVCHSADQSFMASEQFGAQRETPHRRNFWANLAEDVVYGNSFLPKGTVLGEVLDTNMFLSFLPIHRSDLGREQVTFPNMRLGTLTFPPQLTIAEINLEDDKTTSIPCISKNVCWVMKWKLYMYDTAIVTHTGNVNVYLRFITFKQGTEEELQFTKRMFTSKSLLL